MGVYGLELDSDRGNRRGRGRQSSRRTFADRSRKRRGILGRRGEASKYRIPMEGVAIYATRGALLRREVRRRASCLRGVIGVW